MPAGGDRRRGDKGGPHHGAGWSPPTTGRTSGNAAKPAVSATGEACPAPRIM